MRIEVGEFSPETHYEVVVGFDDGHCSVSDQESYFGAMDTLDASGTGHEKTHTSSLSFFGPPDITKQQLQEILGDEIPIIRIVKS